MKKILLALCAALVLFASPAMAQKVKIGVSIPSADHGWTGGLGYYAQMAIKDITAKDKNVEFTLTLADSPQKQVSDVEDLMVKGVKALVVLAYDSSTLTPTIKKAHEQGIYIVSVDRGLTEPVQDVYLAGDNPGLGQVSAEYMGKAMGGKGKMVILEGIPCVINSERVDTFKGVMKAKFPGIEILDSQPANWDTQKGLEVMQTYLQKYPQIDAVWAQDDDILTGVLQAYKESGRKDIKLMVGGAGSKAMVKRVMDGDPMITADVTYPPSMIYPAISLSVLGVRGQNLPGFIQAKIPSEIIIAAELITKANAKQYYDPKSPF
ncbi:MAG TPA: ABC transporter substrate-binding protein [Rectinemataceae bacterium]|nr:ABC transporter substrate-binding protein [Rectinemataceae bacterium]